MLSNFEIKTVTPYTEEYNALTRRARKELDTDFRPKLRDKVQDVAAYDVVFIGYPNWWGTYPMAVKSFLTEYDLAKKIIVPFCTHEGSGLGRSVADLTALYPRATIREGLALRGSSAQRAQKTVSQWLSKTAILK